MSPPRCPGGGAGAPGAHGVAESNNAKVQCEHKSVPRASNRATFLRALRPCGALGGPSEGCSRGIDRETSHLTDLFAGCVTLPPPRHDFCVLSSHCRKKSPGWARDTPGPEVHITSGFRHGASDVSLGAGTGPVRPLWVQRELRCGEEIPGGGVGTLAGFSGVSRLLKKIEASGRGQINIKRLRATGKFRPP